MQVDKKTLDAWQSHDLFMFEMGFISKVEYDRRVQSQSNWEAAPDEPIEPSALDMAGISIIKP